MSKQLGKHLRRGLLALALGLPAAGASASDYIRDYEQALRDLGFEPGQVDGRFDMDLDAAIRSFQASNGLPVNGQLDRPTRAMISSLSTPEPAPVVGAGDDAGDGVPAPVFSYGEGTDLPQLCMAWFEEQRETLCATPAQAENGS